MAAVPGGADLFDLLEDIELPSLKLCDGGMLAEPLTTQSSHPSAAMMAVADCNGVETPRRLEAVAVDHHLEDPPPKGFGARVVGAPGLYSFDECVVRRIRIGGEDVDDGPAPPESAVVVLRGDGGVYRSLTTSRDRAHHASVIFVLYLQL